MIKKIKFVLSLICVLLLIVSLTACSVEGTPNRVTADELEALREQYPFYDSTSSMGQMIRTYDEKYPTFDVFAKYQDYYAVVVVEFTGEWYDMSTYVPPYDDENLNNMVSEKTPAVGNVTWVAHDAKVSQILWGGDDLKKNDTITLGFGGTSYVAGLDLEKCFIAGQKYVCFITDERDRDLGFDVENLYGAAKHKSFYLTPSNVLLSIMDIDGLNETSGMYLAAFESFVSEILDMPDAELTPVEPELEVE